MEPPLYEATYWDDSGCFSDTFDTIKEAKAWLYRKQDMGATKIKIERVD